jgi:hypothetical protein
MMKRAGLIVAVIALGGCVEDAYWTCFGDGRCFDPAFKSIPKRPAAGTPVFAMPVVLEWTRPDSAEPFEYDYQMVACDHSMPLGECFVSGAEVKCNRQGDVLVTLDQEDLPPFSGSNSPSNHRIAWRVRACPRRSPEECGPWSPPSYFRLGHPGGPVLGDVLKSGKAEIVIGDKGYGTGGQGQGGVFIKGFELSPILGSAGTAMGGSLALVDYNKDGKLDVMSVADDAGTRGEPAVAWGQPSGLPASFALIDNVGKWSRIARAGDVDGDSMDDVVLSGGENINNPMGLLFGTGNLKPMDTAQFGPLEEQIAAPGDLNGDDYDDVVAVDSNNRVRVFWGPGVDAPFFLTSALFGVRVAPAGDLDKDGFADLAVFQDTHLAIHFGAQDLATRSTLDWSPPMGHLIIDAIGGDFRGEGKTQVAVSVNRGTDKVLYIFKVEPSGGPGTPLTLKGPVEVKVWPASDPIVGFLAALGDTDNDGHEDIGSRGTVGSFPFGARILLLDAVSVFSDSSYVPLGATASCCTIGSVR